jgi:hypothetical protein
VSRLPVSTFFRKLGYAEEREKEKLAREVIGWWATSRAIDHALTASKDVPPRSKEEAEKKTNWAKVAQYVDWREEHDFEWSQALRSPQHFARLVGMTEVTGEPPPETILTLEEHKRLQAERKRAAAEEARPYLIDRMRRAAQSGGSFAPAG